MENSHFECDEILVDASTVGSLADLARVLRQLRRREARTRLGPELTYRELATRMSCSPASIGYYFSGAVLAPIERFDELVRHLGANAVEREALAQARDRVAEGPSPVVATGPVRVLPPAVDAVSEVPRSLPAPPTGFVGRTRALHDLDVGSVGAGPTVISAVSGMAGVGKTALALRWAHQSIDRFPDGQLYVNLRGFDPSEPVAPAAALQLLLGMLGVAPADVPRELPERIDRYRDLLARRRMLVVLDNASDVTQVRPLLAPGPSQVLVTSRDALDELVDAEGARRITLDVLADEEAVALIRGLVGERCDHEPDAVRSLAVLCGWLPLALRVAAEQAVARPRATLASVVDELAAQADGPDLDAFETGDARSDVRAVLSWSLRSLPPAAARAFVLLGLAPADGVDPFGLAALAAVPLPEAQRLLDLLSHAHLVGSAAQDRYSMHDLLRAYAVELAGRELDAAARTAARHRLLDYYLRAATAATEVQFPFSCRARPANQPEHPGTAAVPDLSTIDKATAWLSDERQSLVRLAVEAVAHGFPNYTVAFALVLRSFLDIGYDQHALAVHGAAFDAATALGERCDPADRASVQACLGLTHLRLGHLEVAAEHLERAFAGHIAADDQAGAVMSSAALGIVRDTQGRYHDAQDCQMRGLALARSAGLRVQEAAQLSNVALTHLRLEEYDQAAGLYRQSMDSLAQLGRGEPPPLLPEGLARALEGLGRYDEAMESALASLEAAESYNDADGRVQAIDAIASVNRLQGRFDEAAESLEGALAPYRDAGRRATIAQALNTLGEIYVDSKQPERALDRYADALAVALRVGDRLQVARALLGLGDAHAAVGAISRAHTHWRQALDAYAQMRLPTADRVRERLSSPVIG